MMHSRIRQTAFVGATLLVVLAVCVAPLAVLVRRALREDGGMGLRIFAEAFLEQRQWTLLGNSLLIGLGTVAVALVLGAGAALALQYCPRILREILGLLLCLPLLIPAYVFAIAWLDAVTHIGLLPREFTPETLIPPYLGIPGVIVVSALAYYPIVLICTWSALRRFDRRKIESARLIADPLQTFFAIRAPLCAPWVFTGVALVFLLTLTGYAVPALFQVNVYSVEIFSGLSVYNKVSRTLAHALPLVLAGGIVLWLWRGWARPRQRWLIPPDDPVGRMPVGWKRAALAVGFCTAITGMALAAPLLFLALRTGSLAELETAWTAARPAVAASLVLASVSATFVMALAFAMAYITHSWPRPSKVFHISFVPFLVTGPLLGTGVIALWNYVRLGQFAFGAFFAIAMACAAKYLYFAYQAERMALQALPPGPLDAAAVYDVSWLRRGKSVAAPMTASVLAVVWGTAFVVSMRELDAAILTAPDVTPLAVRIHTLAHGGPGPLLAATCLVLVGLLVAAGCATAVMYVVCRRVFHAYH